MKLALIFLSVLVAITHQQLQRRGVSRFLPYLPQRTFFQPDYYNDVDDFNPFFHYFRPSRPVSYLQESPQEYQDTLITDQQYADSDNMMDIQSRRKGYGPFHHLTPDREQSGRFFFNYGTDNNIRNRPLMKTVTFSLTSTCTAITFTTCIPRANLLPDIAVGGDVVPCRRKRQTELKPSEDYNQFPIFPTEVRLVMPTQQPLTSLSRNTRQMPTEILSSKNEILGSNGFIVQSEHKSRNKRLMNFWQSFATGTTITSWSVISSIFTSTFIPVAPAAVPPNTLPCLPPGLFVCPAAGK